MSVRVRSPKDVELVEDAVKKLGFNTFSIVDATRSMRQFFAILDLFLGDLWKPCAGGCLHRHREHSGHGDPGAPPRDWNHEGFRC
jgi:hypothetical protein